MKMRGRGEMEGGQRRDGKKERVRVNINREDVHPTIKQHT